MKEKFEHYNLELEEVLIGTPSSPENDTQIETILKPAALAPGSRRTNRNL